MSTSAVVSPQVSDDVNGYLGRLLGQLVSFRHDLHAHPELKFEEHRTADKICGYLKALGLPVHRGLGKTGVVATIHGKDRTPENSGRTIGLRADMDALPM